MNPWSATTYLHSPSGATLAAALTAAGFLVNGEVFEASHDHALRYPMPDLDLSDGGAHANLRLRDGATLHAALVPLVITPATPAEIFA